MNTAIKNFWFLGDENPPVVGSADGSPWRKKLTKTAGSPDVLTDNGFMVLSLDATLENQIATLYQGDELPFDIDNLLQLDIWAKLSTASLHAAISCAFGLISAHNNDLDLVAAAAMFRCYGSNAVVCETDDGTNNNDDVASGQTLKTTVKRFTIDFASGVKAVVPPPSVGGKANVLFSVDDDRSNLRQVARATRFDMSNYSSNLQLFAQIQKGAASSVIAADVSASLSIQRFRVKWKTD